MMSVVRRKRSVLPGFGITMGFTILYLSLVVLIPLAGVVVKTTQQTWGLFWETVSSPRVLAAIEVSLTTSWSQPC